MKFNLASELKFAVELYKKATSGFEDVPSPVEFMEKAEDLSAIWVLEKESMLEDNPKEAKLFLNCATAKYLDFMSALYVKALENI